MREGLRCAGSTWWLLRLMNAATISREWVALQHAHLMPFADTLLRGAAGRKLPPSQRMSIPPAMRTEMEQACNQPQVGGGGLRVRRWRPPGWEHQSGWQCGAAIMRHTCCHPGQHSPAA